MTTSTHINIEQAIELVNRRGTTFEDVCKFVYNDVEAFQNTRELFYLNELKEQVKLKNPSNNEIKQIAEHLTEEIIEKVKKDVKTFCINYAKNSIDSVLDGMNEKRFKYKRSAKNLLVLLHSLQELNEKIE